MQKNQKTQAFNGLNRQIVDNAPISIIVINKNGVITFANKYYKNISATKNPVGKNIFRMPFFIRENLSNRYKKLLAHGKAFKKDNCVSANSLEYINILAVPLKNTRGDITGALSMATDVTQIVSAKLELKKVNANLKKTVAERTRQLLETNEKLTKSLGLKSQFISDASHEIRTPLSIAKLNIELFRNQLCGENKQAISALNAIDVEIDRIADILSDITFFTAIDENPIEKMNIEKISVKGLISSVASRLKIMGNKRNIKIFLENNSADYAIKGDKIKLEKLLLNIMGNSIKYGKKNGWVKISLKSDAKRDIIKIIVSDNGIGIAKKDLSRVFDRFYRTHLSRRHGEGGFGLGLAVCKWIAEQHGGSISAESALGKGSVFTIKLPLLLKK